jgi:hypothetical protein
LVVALAIDRSHRDEFEIFDELPDGDFKLVGESESREMSRRGLPRFR